MTEPNPDAILTPAAPTYSWWQVWIYSFTQPTVENFDRLIADPRAGKRRAISWAVLSNLSALLFGLVAVLAGVGLVAAALKDNSGVSLPVGLGLMCFSLPLLMLVGVIGLLLNAAICHLIAKLMGGSGSYWDLVYGMSTYLVPVTVVSAVISFIPVVGFLGSAVGLYSVFLDVVAIKAVHRFGWGKASAAALIPFALQLLFIGCLALAAFVAAGSSIPWQELFRR